MDYKKALQDMKENTPNTALEWYEREMFKTGFIQHLHIFDEIFRQAKSMEKEQIIKAVDSNFNYDNNEYPTLGEQYYTKIYNK
jgi:hypothetical protein